MSTHPYPSTRGEALARLEDFLPTAGRYGRDRNGVLPGHPNVSRLSAALRSRLITEEEVLRRVLSVHPFPAVEKFVQEVVWRTYWKGWLELRPQVWTIYRERVVWLRQNAPEPVLRRAEEVAAGRSGVAVMDRFARELLTTGYLHNHARMWWASFWIHVERLPWELGADFFFRHLLDADPASNTLSWRWVAGLQTPGKVYLVRRSNLERFADPSWLDDTSGLGRLDDSRVEAADVEEHADLKVRPLAVLPEDLEVSRDPIGLWLHEEDGLLETSPVTALRRPTLVSTPLESDPEHPLSPVVQTWKARAISDACGRAGSHFQSGARMERSTTGSLAEPLAGMARLQGCPRLVGLAPAAGPISDQLGEIRRHLETQGVNLNLVRRRWDSTLWPWASRGFFPFWERVRGRLGSTAGGDDAVNALLQQVP